MEDECGASDKSLGVPRSESKGSLVEKRTLPEVEERSEFGQRRVKMRDLESVFRSEGRTASDAVHHASREINLNTNACTPNVVAGDNMACAEEFNLLSSIGQQEKYNGIYALKSRDFGLDLNAGDFSSSNNVNTFHPCKNYEHLKSRDDSECGSSVCPSEEKDPMKLWKEMKQNGFLSSSHGGVPMPKPRGRKSKFDGIKRKMELARKEQVDRFAKIAAPSGLLNELNPGIINHVRNSKQVHSIIEALVRSEKLENSQTGSKEGDESKSGTKDISEKDLKRMTGSELNRYSVSHEAGSMSIFPGINQPRKYSPLLNESVSFNSELTGGDDESCMVDMRTFGSVNCFSHPNLEGEDDILALKLSTSTAMASENTSSLSNDDSANLTAVTSLSVKAASVAAHWLELIHQDIKGRLAALRRSKKRVRAVIHTELPFLLAKEFPSDQESHSTADAHRNKWNALFDQMDKTLSEEERQLESWLNQVREMQLHCDQGLVKYQTIYNLGTLENDCRLQKPLNSDRDLAVRAAAASIYSTCNFLSSMEDLSCC